MVERKITDIMYTFVILNNMILHDSGQTVSLRFFREEQHRVDDPIRMYEETLETIREIHNKTSHLSLKADLVELT